MQHTRPDSPDSRVLRTITDKMIIEYIKHRKRKKSPPARIQYLTTDIKKRYKNKTASHGAVICQSTNMDLKESNSEGLKSADSGIHDSTHSGYADIDKVRKESNKKSS